MMLEEVLRSWATVLWRKLSADEQRALLDWVRAAQKLPEWERLSPGIRAKVEEVVRWLERM